MIGASSASACSGLTIAGQRLVLDDDGLAAVLGDVRVVGDHAGDLLALEANLVGGEHGLRVVGQRRHPREVALRGHLAGQHQPHAGDLPRLAGVDGLDARVRHRAAQDLHVQHAGQHDVVDVVAAPADEPRVLDPVAAGAEPTDLDLVECGHVSSVGPQLLGRPQDGLDDVLVAGAAAEVARQRPADVLLGGVGLRSSNAIALIIIPGVQNPHWRPCSSRNPSWTGCSSLGRAMPSTVRTSCPSAWTASIVQDFTGAPSYEHRARAAVRGVAADVGAGQPEALAQQVREQHPRLDLDDVRPRR